MRDWVVISICLLSVVPLRADPKRAGPDWWSLQPIKKQAVIQETGSANPIDAYVASRLKRAGLEKSPEADRATLIRRVSFDITGLPPTPADLAAFAADRSPGAYERMVDRYLASPHYGERWARHWLDIVRFAESHGFEYDRLRDNAWPYRDYVIHAFNADRPYARFVQEQLAGDVLSNATPETTVATGMLVAGPFDQAGSGSVSMLIRGKAREDELEDILGTVSQTFLGVTLNCARCHDHKIDPYSAKDYYRLKAVFAGTFGGDRNVIARDEVQRRAVEAKNAEHQLAGVLERISKLEAAGRQRVLRKQDRAAADPNPRPLARWTFERDGRDSIGDLHATPRNGATVENGRLKLPGGTAFAETTPLGRDLGVKTLEAWVTLATLDQGGGGVLGVQTLNGQLFDSIVYAERNAKRWMAGSNGFVRTKAVQATDEGAKSSDLVHVAITYAADGSISIYRNGRPYGEGYVAPGFTAPVTFRAKESQVLLGLRHTGGGNPYFRGEIEEARLYDRALTPEQILASFRAGIDNVSAQEVRNALSATERTDLETGERALTELQAKLAQLRQQRQAYAVNPRIPGQTFVLRRGDVEKIGEAVTPGTPEVIAGPPPLNLPVNESEGERRLRFAEWVTHRDNPLTWRVIVNRVWQHHFGDGLVRTPNDFGLNGDLPSHPELLDWLATEFRDRGGSMKWLHRQIVTSATYKQASTFQAKAAEVDVDNRLHWRFAPRRLEAEAVRDAMLATSGKLNVEAGGPSTRPFRIENFNSSFYIMFDEDRPAFNRRSVYRMNVNSARDPVLDVLDCPDPSVKTPRRATTTTPLQALTLMNNPFTQRMVNAFAERVKSEAGGDTSAQIGLAYVHAFGREPTAIERDRASKVIAGVGLQAMCWAILNSSEFAYVK